MKVVRFSDIAQIPASHEDPKDPAVMKRILFRLGDLNDGRIQMINWAALLPGKTFAGHYHQDMQELFIMMAGGAIGIVREKEVTLSRGDALVVDPGETHQMKNPGNTPIEYLVIGIA